MITLLPTNPKKRAINRWRFLTEVTGSLLAPLNNLLGFQYLCTISCFLCKVYSQDNFNVKMHKRERYCPVVIKKKLFQHTCGPGMP